MGDKQKNERKKGRSLIALPEDYTVVDLETTGFSTIYNDIIEVGAIKYRGGKEVDRYQRLIKPATPIPYVIECMTGIKNEMVENAPIFKEIAEGFLYFLKDETIVGHNVNFDINFLYDNFKRTMGIDLVNDYIDTMRMARYIIPNIKEQGYKGYGLDTLCRYFQVTIKEFYEDETDEIVDKLLSGTFPNKNRHRAIGDCLYTNEVFKNLKRIVTEKQINLSELEKETKQRGNLNNVLKNLKKEKNFGDENHVFFGKCCVFTGKLEEFTRVEAAQIVVNIGGYCENGVTKRTNFLIVGDMDYKAGLEGYESSKLKKAKKLIEEHQELTIIPESAFYDLVENYLGKE